MCYRPCRMCSPEAREAGCNYVECPDADVFSIDFETRRYAKWEVSCPGCAAPLIHAENERAKVTCPLCREVFTAEPYNGGVAHGLVGATLAPIPRTSPESVLLGGVQNNVSGEKR